MLYKYYWRGSYWSYKISKYQITKRFLDSSSKTSEKSIINLLIIYYNYFVRSNNIGSVTPKHETLFVIASSLKQYKPYIIGITDVSYTQTSAGRLLCTKGLTTKSFKKDLKGFKATLDFFKSNLTTGLISGVCLRPLNKKNYKLLAQILKSPLIINIKLIFTQTYNIMFRKTRRIKKRIRKKLLAISGKPLVAY